MKPTLKTLTAAACYLLIASTIPGHAGLTDGLEAYYPLNGSADDASGHGFTGTLINVSAAADRFGQPNSSLVTPSLLRSLFLCSLTWGEDRAEPNTGGTVVREGVVAVRRPAVPSVDVKNAAANHAAPA